MDTFKIVGRIYKVSETVQITDKFKKRDIIIDHTTSNQKGTFVEYIKMQAVQEKCGDYNSFEKGDMVEIEFRLTGRKMGEKPDEKVYTNVDAVSVRLINKAQTGVKSNSQLVEDTLPMGDGKPEDFSLNTKEVDDDLPF